MFICLFFLNEFSRGIIKTMSSPNLEMAVGLKKGHKVTKNATSKVKPSRQKGVSNTENAIAM